MSEYVVMWDIELDASSPEEAAREALRIQRDPASIATVFTVRLNEEGAQPERIDLLEEGRARNRRKSTY